MAFKLVFRGCWFLISALTRHICRKIRNLNVICCIRCEGEEERSTLISGSNMTSPFPITVVGPVVLEGGAGTVSPSTSAWPPPTSSTTMNGNDEWNPKRRKSDTHTPKERLSQKLTIQRTSVFQVMKQLASDNSEYFCRDSWWPSPYTPRIAKAADTIATLADICEQLVDVLQEVAPRYDYDEKTPGNGFRSLVCVVDTTVLHLIRLLKQILEQRTSFVFRSSHWCKELEAYTAVLSFLAGSIGELTRHLPKWPTDCLFPVKYPEEGDTSYMEIMKKVDQLDTTCFYGRAMGFQFCSSANRIFQLTGVVLASYSMQWEKGTGIQSLLSSGKFLLSPEQRARRIIKVTRGADVSFCKGFWNLAEGGIYAQLPTWFCPVLAVNEAFGVPIDVGPLYLPSEDKDRPIKITVPSAHTGPRPVNARILSHCVREGMKWKSGSGARVEPKSPYLLFHCHGGGYVALSSKSHESYLRHWAKLLNCPILSIDYSLAPENPFPRPSEEVLYAYAWARNNPELLGWTGEKMVWAGDSAGGNLLTAVSLRAMKMGVKQLADAMVLIYASFLLQFLPSPSRVLSLMDPQLHMGIVLRCAAAYAGLEQADTNSTTEVPQPTPTDETLLTSSSNEPTHPSLQEYYEELVKSNVVKVDCDTTNGEIVNLVNLNTNTLPDQQPIEITPTDSAVSFELGTENEDYYAPTPTPPPPTTFTTTDNEGSSWTGVISDGRSNSCDTPPPNSTTTQTSPHATVEIHRDPSRICLTSSIYDRELVEYLKKNPLTKDSLILCDTSETKKERTETEQPSDIDDTCEWNNTDINHSSVASSSSPKNPLRRTPCVNQIQSNNTTDEDKAKTSAAPVSEEKRTLRRSLTETLTLVTGHAYDNLSNWFEQPSASDHVPLEKTDQLSDGIKGTFDTSTSSSSDEDEEILEKHKKTQQETLMDRMRKLRISPLYASDDELRRLPPCWFIACHMDPLVDDTVAFARRINKAGGTVMSVDLLDSIPHGFLNFTLMSTECREAAKLCLNRIRQAFQQN